MTTLTATNLEGKFDPRREQLPPPGDWTIWFMRGGRGSGKTRPGAEQVAEFLRTHPHSLVGAAAPKIAKFRDLMMEGPSGLLSVLPPSALRGGSLKTSWSRSMSELYLANGAKVKGFSAQKPDEPRGYNLGMAWVDEPAEFPDAHVGLYRNSTVANLLFALRVGEHPQMVVTGTPARSTLIDDLVAHPRCKWVKFSTHRNAMNLSETFYTEILSAYEGTTLGRQEIYAEILDDVEGALWNSALINRNRLTKTSLDEDGLSVFDLPDMRSTVLGIDPSMGGEAGIVHCGIDKKPKPTGYILGDYSTVGRGAVWGKVAVEAYHDLGCKAMVIETNLPPKAETIGIIRAIPGGETVRIIDVTARQGKAARAEPIVSLQEQDRIKWVGSHALLEGQCTTWKPPTDIDPSDWSPNRLDAMVWGFWYLMVKAAQKGARIYNGGAGIRIPSTSRISQFGA